MVSVKKLLLQLVVVMDAGMWWSTQKLYPPHYKECLF
jgi:hypothetical protein